jgi:hypothetical protein
MKFEEILPAYRDGEIIEYYNDQYNKWIQMPGIGSNKEGNIAKWNIAKLMYDEFRIKDGKNKTEFEIVKDEILNLFDSLIIYSFYEQTEDQDGLYVKKINKYKNQLELILGKIYKIFHEKLEKTNE